MATVLSNNLWSTDRASACNEILLVYVFAGFHPLEKRSQTNPSPNVWVESKQCLIAPSRLSSACLHSENAAEFCIFAILLAHPSVVPLC